MDTLLEASEARVRQAREAVEARTKLSPTMHATTPREALMALFLHQGEEGLSWGVRLLEHLEVSQEEYLPQALREAIYKRWSLSEDKHFSLLAVEYREFEDWREACLQAHTNTPEIMGQWFPLSMVCHHELETLLSGALLWKLGLEAGARVVNALAEAKAVPPLSEWQVLLDPQGPYCDKPENWWLPLFVASGTLA